MTEKNQTKKYDCMYKTNGSYCSERAGGSELYSKYPVPKGIAIGTTKIQERISFFFCNHLINGLYCGLERKVKQVEELSKKEMGK